VAAWRKWTENGQHGDPPPVPSLDDIAELGWPGNVILARQLHGYRGSRFDEPEMRLL
jgi:hypothetical protein